MTLSPRLSRAYLLRNGVYPERWTPSGAMQVASTSDVGPETLGDLDVCYAARIEVRKVKLAELEALVERMSGQRSETPREAPPGTSATDMRDLIHEAPVVRYVDLLLQDALDLRASDVHLESSESGSVVRFRIDGRLTPALAPPDGLHDAVVSRIK